MLTINGSNPIIPAAHISYDNKGGVPIFHSCYLNNYGGQGWGSYTLHGIQNQNPNYIIVSPGFKLVLYTYYYYTHQQGTTAEIDNLDGKDAVYVERTDITSSIRVYYKKNGTETEIVNDPDILLSTTSTADKIAKTSKIGEDLSSDKFDTGHV